VEQKLVLFGPEVQKCLLRFIKGISHFDLNRSTTFLPLPGKIIHEAIGFLKYKASFGIYFH
jgi:hypothetical protein